MSIPLNTLAIILSNFVVRAIGFATSLISRRLLGPELAGLWSWVQTISTYSVCINSGVELGAERNIPFVRGRENAANEHIVRHQMFAGAITESALVAAVLILIVIFSKQYLSPDWRLAFSCAAGYVVLWRLTGCFMIACRASNQFVLLGKLQVIFAIFDLLLILLLVPHWRFAGQCIAFGLGLLAKVLLWLYISRLPSLSFGWHLDRQSWLSLIAIGFPLMIIGLLWQVLITVDGLIVGKFISFTALGYYSMGISTGRAVAEIPTAFSAVVFPRLMEDFGKSDDAVALGQIFLRNMMAAIYVLIPPIICAFYFGLPLITRFFLPRFIPAIPVIKVMTISAIFLSLTHLCNQVFTAMKRLRTMLFLIAAAIVLTASSAYFLAPRGIYTVALAVLACYFAYSSTLFIVAASVTLGFKEALRSYALLFGGIAYTVGILLLLDRAMLSRTTTSIWGSVAYALGSMIIGILSQAVLFVKANRELKVAERLRLLWESIL